ncbi:peroxiredoxin-like family protein [Endobacter medicaginis]
MPDIAVAPLSLGERFRALQQERERSWSPAALAINAGQRATLRRTHDAARHVRVGDVLPDTELRREDGTLLSLDALVDGGSVVLVFFRFATCPACNIALPYYRDTLAPALAAAGVTLLAVSPQPYPALGEIARRHALPFEVVSDPALSLSRALGITYVFDDASRAVAEARGERPETLNGVSQWELPKPAVLVVGPGRIAQFVDVSPDWMDRTESAAVLEALGLDARAADLARHEQEQIHAA